MVKVELYAPGRQVLKPLSLLTFEVHCSLHAGSVRAPAPHPYEIFEVV